LVVDEYREYTLTYPIGRRVCVGWNVGEMNVWIAAARLLYCFDFTEDSVWILFLPIFIVHCILTSRPEQAH
jgi:hypothetical protein